MTTMTTRPTKCPCGRTLSQRPSGAITEFVICRICYEKLPQHLSMALRFRAGHNHTSRQAYRNVQKAAVHFIEGLHA